MGMYTEIFVRAEFDSKDLHPANLAMLKFMVEGGETVPHNIPKHELFETSRWTWMLQSNSYYHVPFATMRFQEDMGTWYLIGRADLKNYDNEIEKFFDWIGSFVYCRGDKTFIGYSLYEEAEGPVLFYAPWRDK